jgi:hypothetical protein
VDLIDGSPIASGSAEMTLVTHNDLFARFHGNPPASLNSIVRRQADLRFPLPADYVQFLQQMNGGEGFIGKNFLRAWPVEDLIQANKECFVDVAAPDLFLFGSSGGGEAFAFDTRSSPRRSSLSHLLCPWKTRS